jgi:hypothetical protein
MVWLRLLLLAGCLGAIALSAATAPWEARLVRGNHSWIMDLGRHPAWQPPAAPDYTAFRQHFDRSEDFPPPDGGWVIRVSYDPVDVGLAALAYSWPVAAVCGLLYLAVRGPRRDVVLHCALRVAAGLSIAVAACVGLWCVVGGWGPPAVGCFGVLGVVGGIVSGLMSFSQGTPNHPLQQTGGA